MCYAYGSIDQATGVCPMCKVFKPSGARCPHVKDICQNRSTHPRHDVVYLKNAEVQTFNGCGFCKWARANHAPNFNRHQNTGWPGCCRPPVNASEQRLIQAADWPAVSLVHHIPVPPEIKSLLDSIGSRGSPVPSISSRGSGGSPSLPSLDRRNSANSSPSNKPAVLGKSSPIAVPSKSRSGGSPQQASPALSGSLSKATGVNVPPSTANCSPPEQVPSPRRQPGLEPVDKRGDQQHSSPARKNVDLDGSVSRRNSGRRGTVTASTAPPITPAQAAVDSPPASLRHRPSLAGASHIPKLSLSSPNSRPAEQHSVPVISRAHIKRPSLEVAVASMKISASPPSSTSASSDGSSHSGSISDSTVTSDGGFTDYLSDESEAELQRQAEAKAALVAQNQLEEMEFRAARQQLTHVDLRPPKSWSQPVASSNSGQRY